MKYYLIAGEASGDLHASNLMASIKVEDPHADFRFFGGYKMQAVGGTLVKHYRDMAYMGFIPVLLHARTILNNMRCCKDDILQWKPDVVILVDYPGFNLKIAEFAHEHGFKVFYYIAPKIWAWKEYRIKSIRRNVDALFSILPFEVEWFAQRDYKINYVGNPCVDAIHNSLAQTSPPLQSLQIAILAGSRRQEIKDNLRIMLEAASSFKDYRLVLAGAPNIEANFYRQFIPKGVDVDIQFGRTYNVLRQSSAALVTSGTATLETAILRVPQVVCYYVKGGAVMKLLRRMFIKVPYVSLVNLVMGRSIVKELVISDMTVENVRSELSKILPDGSHRETMLADYDEMNRKLGGPGASERAARIMIEKIIDG